MHRLFLIIASASLLLSQLTVFKDHIKISKEEYKERRQKLLEKLPDHPIVFVGNTLRNRINDTDYEFRQESNFYYLTGLNEENAYLILSKKPFNYKGKMVNELIFVKENGKMEEAYDGKKRGTKNVMEELGIEMAAKVTSHSEGKPTHHFEEYLKSFTKEFPSFYLHTPIIKAKQYEQNVSYYELYSNSLLSSLNNQENIDEETKRVDIKILNQDPLKGALLSLRNTKSEQEIKMLQRAVDITISGHFESFKMAKHSHSEYQVEAAIEFAFKFNGAEHVGYNSIVGCGANSTILHYNTNRDDIKHKYMFCLDAGAEYRNYTADITRSFPADGTFSKEQLDIYNIVLAAQAAGAKELVPGSNYMRVAAAINMVSGEGLKKLGLISFEKEVKTLDELEKLSFQDIQNYIFHDQVQLTPDFILPKGSPIFPQFINVLKAIGKKEIAVINASQLKELTIHGWGHHVGLDVHDPGNYQNFNAGMVWTIEPGIYVSDRITFDVDEKYMNIGIRIEDMYRITENGNVCMSEKLPRDPKEIERIMKQKSALLLPPTIDYHTH